MLSGLLSLASNPICTYFYPPIEDEEEEEKYRRYSSVPKHIDWKPLDPPDSKPAANNCQNPLSGSHCPLSPLGQSCGCCGKPSEPNRLRVIEDILSEDDLYKVLGVQRVVGPIDKETLRRAYLTRSRKCHPDKFPGVTDATKAFQKVSMAYNVLSQPTLKNNYDSMPQEERRNFDPSRSQPPPEETFRSVLLGAFNDFLDGDLEDVRSFLRTTNNLNSSLKLGEEGIESFLMTLQSIRQRALTCRTCVWTLHGELCHLLELQHAFRQLAYTDVRTRSRLTIQIVRITINLPLKIEQALKTDYLQRQGRHTHERNGGQEAHPRISFISHGIWLAIRRIVAILERMENGLK